MSGAAIVVDASVAVKWVIDEEHTDRVPLKSIGHIAPWVRWIGDFPLP